jgi:DNA helicase II / ATP-dependent DNA helicase PcrA
VNAPFQLHEDDLAHLKTFFPRLRFDRDEQTKALLHAASGDFQAAPGSGKTTLLGAKLALMAARWPNERRGICILTHTNVAREEIESCLRSAPHGEKLLGYPHFIGTIQAFVNRFLALPWLRSLGIELREIDDDAFEDRFFRLVNADYSVKKWVSVNAYQRESTIRGVRYRGAALDVATTGQTALPATGAVITRVRAMKELLLKEGRVRHEDMLAFSEAALAGVPELADSLEHRFPNVFIDEMQDTSDPQLEVLTKVFRTCSSVQRFGDVNQSILGRGPRTAAQAFPVAGCHEVKTSLRFGVEIAAVANAVKAVGDPIEGHGDPAIAPPALLLYSDETVKQVIARFGRWLAPLVTVEQLDRYPVKAICAIKRTGNAKQPVGRHVRDYFPEYDDTAGKAVGGRTSVRELLRAAAGDTGSAERRSGAARQAILLLLDTYGKGAYKNARSWRDLVQLLSQSQLPRVRLTVLNCILGEHDVSTEANTRGAIQRVLRELGELVDPAALSTAIPGAWLLDGGASAQASKTQPNLLTVKAAAVEIPVHIATIAAVKGETHLATLVLESCFNMAYDLQSALPFLCGDQSAAAIADDALKSQVMNVFVASTRPRRLLAFAMHADRASLAAQTKLTAKGWSVLDWTSPESSLASTPTI